ncbi:unnamed protein product [Darwinula stevensoni]|uniref:Ammonium transporter AmtB-like domain-containing protein n=1 Tax=Darwinula stevensoni TaxID=69355 RepID=A0A7R9FQA3_9CRUS|nr:unnamed protein product [Darwinula stevensoni]CAG0899114.1 unnamed protein product [Darwinula stevensoni]
MQAGFAFMEAGAVRSKNTVNILIKNLLDMLIGGIAYWLIGFPLAFGSEGNFFLSYSYWANYQLPSEKYGHWFFDFVHAATASTLVSGSMAERCNFYAYLLYSFLITGFIYPVASHWAWHPKGWLKVTAFKDYAGGCVVHMLGGMCALVGAALMGPRIGRFHKKTGEAHDIRGHSVPLAALGGFILLFGFLAFNAGFRGHISHPGDGEVISRAIVNALLGACGGGVGALVIHRAGTFGPTHAWSFLMTLNGALAGLVGVCAGSDVFPSWAALVVGVGAGFTFLCLHFLLLKLKVDDPLDAFPVHFGGGFFGIVAVAFFMEDGIIFNPSRNSALRLLGLNPAANSALVKWFPGLTNFTRPDIDIPWIAIDAPRLRKWVKASPDVDTSRVLGWNLAGAAAISGWSATLCLILFGILKKFGILRVDKEMEIRGMDVIKHNEPAYPSTAWEDCDPGQYGTSTMATKIFSMMSSTKRTEEGLDRSSRMQGPFAGRQMSRTASSNLFNGYSPNTITTCSTLHSSNDPDSRAQVSCNDGIVPRSNSDSSGLQNRDDITAVSHI